MAILILENPETGDKIRVDYPFAYCEFCGDDIDVHEWISESTCDRSE